MEIKRHTALEYQRRVCLAMNYISENVGGELSLEKIAQRKHANKPSQS
ncbi:hypothetical protein JXQ70_19610 [bacterium]|nr:hypothetical protein [bacterium]